MKRKVLALKPKKRGYGLEMKTFAGRSGQFYLVLKAPGGDFHVFVEVEAKEAGRDCGGTGDNTRTIWGSIWEHERLTSKELVEVKAGQAEFRRGQWIRWQDVRRTNVRGKTVP